MKDIIKKIGSGICSGILVSIGGFIYLALAGENKIVGAVLFAVALLAICYHGFSLYTGRIGYLTTEYSKDYFSGLLLGLFGNAVGTVLFGFAAMLTRPSLADTAKTLCEAKLAQSIPDALFRGILCGIMMYVAVNIWRKKQSPVGIFFCIPVFILAGFEHSIADIFYFAASGIVSLRAFAYIWLIILGNSIGGILLPLLSFAKKE